MKGTSISGDTIILLMLTPYIYFVTYLTEIGYCKYFDIPPEFITLSPGNISSITAILGILYAGIHIIDFCLDKLLLLIDRKSGKRIPGMEMLARSNILTGLVLLVVLMSLIDKNDTSTKSLFISVSAILMIISLSQIALSAKKEGNRHNRDSTDSRSSMISRVFDRKVTTLVVMTALITFPATEKGGEYIGRDQESFYRVNENNGMLCIVIYGDKIIAKELNNGKLGPKTIIVPIRENTVIEKIHLTRPIVAPRLN